MPRRTDLDLNTNNGGITIASVAGTIRFDTTNGGMRLADLGGAVTGRTRNGGLRVLLGGTQWDGEGLDVETSNGGVTLAIPDPYNAQLETRTHNGSFRFDSCFSGRLASACDEIPSATVTGAGSGLADPETVALAADGRSLYASVEADAAIANFAREPQIEPPAPAPPEPAAPLAERDPSSWRRFAVIRSAPPPDKPGVLDEAAPPAPSSTGARKSPYVLAGGALKPWPP